MGRKLLNRKIRSFKEAGPVIGVLGEVGLIKTANYPEGLETLELDTEKGLESFWLDGGLKGAMSLSGVTAGTRVEIVFTGQMDLDAERRVNTYDIFEVTED